MQPQVHMVMGVEEASVIETALGLLHAKIDFDLDRWEDKNEKARDEFMAMLSVKFAVEGMKASIELMLDEGLEDDDDYTD